MHVCLQKAWKTWLATDPTLEQFLANTFSAECLTAAGQTEILTNRVAYSMS